MLFRSQLRARMLGDRTLEVRALNVSGAVALERGGIDEAAYFFTRAQEQAMQDNDMATVGRCANNLGIIANMQGDYARAVGAYTRAIAAYEQAGSHRGIAESRHNLGITYREQGRLDHALQAADAAVRDAEDMLRAVIARATEHDRPLLVATAQRDLAGVLHRIGDRAAATATARAARATFGRLGAKAEVDKLDALEATLQVAPR